MVADRARGGRRRRARSMPEPRWADAPVHAPTRAHRQPDRGDRRTRRPQGHGRAETRRRGARAAARRRSPRSGQSARWRRSRGRRVRRPGRSPARGAMGAELAAQPRLRDRGGRTPPGTVRRPRPDTRAAAAAMRAARRRAAAVRRRRRHGARHHRRGRLRGAGARASRPESRCTRACSPRSPEAAGEVAARFLWPRPGRRAARRPRSRTSTRTPPATDASRRVLYGSARVPVEPSRMIGAKAALAAAARRRSTALCRDASPRRWSPSACTCSARARRPRACSRRSGSHGTLLGRRRGPGRRAWSARDLDERGAPAAARRRQRPRRPDRRPRRRAGLAASVAATSS